MYEKNEYFNQKHSTNGKVIYQVWLFVQIVFIPNIEKVIICDKIRHVQEQFIREVKGNFTRDNNM